VRLTEAMVELVRAGMGVAVLARWAVAREIDNGSLIAIPLTSRGFQRRWQAATLRGAQSKYVKDFIDLLARGVNRQEIAVVREEWRVVDRWWTEEPVSRRYYEVVLASGENTVVFRDQERGGWFSQRGA